MVQTEEERKAKKKILSDRYYARKKAGEEKRPMGRPKGVLNSTKLSDEERKAKQRIANRKYYNTEKGKKAKKAYRKSEAGQAERTRYNLSEKGTPAIRLKVLHHYSKLHSNSDIPCCRCCGQNSHTSFLSVDHILGRYEMESIPELIKIEYDPLKSGGGLFRWIVNNNYLTDLQAEYFQILCHNCNMAKGFYGKCPMENKPH